jgi:hypothetical protein
MSNTYTLEEINVANILINLYHTGACFNPKDLPTYSDLIKTQIDNPKEKTHPMKLRSAKKKIKYL